MIAVDYSGTDIDYKTYEIKQKINSIKKKPIPAFVEHKPPIGEFKKVAKKFTDYKKIIIIGNGASLTSSYAFFKALVKNDKKLYVVNTMEPDYIDQLKNKCSTSETLVVTISKSGNTVGVLEAALQFLEYEMLVVTSKNEGALYNICKTRKMNFVEHPVVGGRYSGRTSCGLLPAAILGLNIAEINKGANAMYETCAPNIDIEKNPALKIATILYALDKRGYHEIFLPTYSTKLWGFNNLIVQLIHESACKEGRGQTVIGALAPESQHHTNQRFFGGRKNILGLFLKVLKQKDNKSKTSIPDDLKEIPLREGTLNDLNGIPLSKSLEFEFMGTKKDADNNRIPNLVVTVEKINSNSIGQFLALWQYVAVYSSYLRDVDPFDQPQVENSKEISFELRKHYHPI